MQATARPDMSPARAFRKYDLVKHGRNESQKRPNCICSSTKKGIDDSFRRKVAARQRRLSWGGKPPFFSFGPDVPRIMDYLILISTWCLILFVSFYVVSIQQSVCYMVLERVSGTYLVSEGVVDGLPRKHDCTCTWLPGE